MKSIKRLFTFIVLAATVTLFHSCGTKDELHVPDVPEMTGLSAPVVLQVDSTFIVLRDYFLHPDRIDSVSTDKGLGYIISPDSSLLTLFVTDKALPKMSEMKIWIDGFRYSLLLKKSPKIWQRFTFDPKEKKYRTVQIAGEMNDWNPAKTYMRLKDDIWETDLLLYPGRYQYKIVADGKWMLDPGNPLSVDNNNGGFNSVMYAGQLTPQEAPVLSTGNVSEKEVTIRVRNRTKEIFAYWQNYRLDSTFIRSDTGGITVRIPTNAAKMDRSWLRVWAYNASGISNEILVPLEDGKVVTNVSALTRSDKHALIIYFMMVDRFMNGNPDNDDPVKDPDVDPKLNYQGGDLAGILKKLEEGYFSELGVNTLWISPITQNPLTAWAEYPPPHRKFTGYHGYWPVTLTTIDTRFGTPAEMKKMVTEAHDQKMNVILDYVSNHVHLESDLYKKHPDWATPLLLPNKKKNIRLWNEQRLTTWFDEFLPTLDLTRPEVYQMMSDSAMFWITEYDLDGFRHDAAKHIPEVYWRILTQKINEQVAIPEKAGIYQIGETFGSRDLIRSYINPGMLDAQFDFSVYFDAREAFSKENSSLKDLNYSLQESFTYFGNHSLMGYITGNQDLIRFISLASGAVSPSENASEAGWKRDIQVKDTLGYNRLNSLIAFNMTIPGVPVIYYGDEIGMAGAGDPDNRRMMRFDSLSHLEKRTKEITTKLANLRKNSLPLIFGDFVTLQISEKRWVYLRSYFDQVAVVIFNKSNEPGMVEFSLPDEYATTPLSSHFGNAFTATDGMINLTVPGNSFEILTNTDKE